MNSLTDGLRGKGLLGINIKDDHYTLTGGNLSKVRSLANELLDLVYGGFMVMCTYETLMHGESFAQQILSDYSEKLKHV